MSSSYTTEYETRLVTIPIITQKSLSHPQRIGPWRIKRSQSSPVSCNSSTFSYNPDNDQPSLKDFLAKVDEQCSQAENAASVSLEKSQLNSDVLTSGRLLQSSHATTRSNDVEPGVCQAYNSVRKAPGVWLVFLLLFCNVFIWVAPAVNSYMFARKAFGGIRLTKEAPTDTIIGLMIGIGAVCVGITSSIAATSLGLIRTGKRLTNGYVLVMVVGGLMIGILLGVWSSYMVLPTIRRV